jgi:hypothetical protein
MGKSVAARNSFRGGRLRDRQRSELRDIKAKISQIFEELDELISTHHDNTLRTAR